MKLCVSSYSYSQAYSPKFTIVDAIEHANKTGFDGMEFQSGTCLNGLSAMDTMKFLADKCAENDMKIYNFIGAVNLLADDISQQIEKGKRIIDEAKAIGSPMVRCDTLSGNGFGAAGSGGMRAAIKRIAEGIGKVADYAGENGIKLIVENHGRIMQDSIIVEELINTVNRPNYGALVDVGNFLCADENPIEGVGRMSRYAMHVHLKDFHFKSGNEVFLPSRGWFGTRGGNYLRGAVLGHGTVPVWQCVRILAENGYNGALSLEFEGIEDTLMAIEESFAAMQKINKMLG